MNHPVAMASAPAPAPPSPGTSREHTYFPRGFQPVPHTSQIERHEPVQEEGSSCPSVSISLPTPITPPLTTTDTGSSSSPSPQPPSPPSPSSPSSSPLPTSSPSTLQSPLLPRQVEQEQQQATEDDETVSLAPSNAHTTLARSQSRPHSYGAINSGSTTNHTPAASVFGSVHRHKHSLTKKASYMWCKFLFAIALILGLGCWLYIRFYSWRLRISVRDNLYANIVVKQSDSWDEETIMVYQNWSASGPELFDAFSRNIHPDMSIHLTTFGFYLDGDSSEMKKRLLRGQCGRVDIQLEYPRKLPGAQMLEIDITHGNVEFQFDKHIKGALPSFEEIAVTVASGNVRLENVPVLNSTRINVIEGQVSGSVRTVGKVDVSLAKGPIDLTVQNVLLDGEEPRDATNMDIRLGTFQGPIDLQVSPSFFGHFDLATSLGQLAIEAEGARLKSKTASQLSGWVSPDRQEPPNASSLINIRANNGDGRLKVVKG
ncbi:hypothetical protein BGZ94_004654 [Podila epigama]|nr:hypothetical protein BGZ94_004654 [Podila epigama]